MQVFGRRPPEPVVSFASGRHPKTSASSMAEKGIYGVRSHAGSAMPSARRERPPVVSAMTSINAGGTRSMQPAPNRGRSHGPEI
jgi:hypothetical protein